MIYKNYNGERLKMKVFISWSGETSKKIATIFRDWLPTVIQSIDPFVSSEDIEKGSRWNTEIAQELKDSTFGLICVTKDNLNAPWLNFEAGALSKTINNSYVAPLLFDVKPSELKGSPISQFQSTSFIRDDMKRLVETLNKATGSSLTSARIDKAFNLCYPDLEKSITELKTEKNSDKKLEEVKKNDSGFDSNILEELLEMTRNTQRLIGNSDSRLYSNLDSLQEKLDLFIRKIDRNHDIEFRKKGFARISPMMLEELLMPPRINDEENVFPYNILIIFSFYKDEMPWLYDACNEMAKVLTSNSSKSAKRTAIIKFRDIIDYTLTNPIIRDRIDSRKELTMILHEIPMLLMSQIDKDY